MFDGSGLKVYLEIRDQLYLSGPVNIYKFKFNNQLWKAIKLSTYYS